ncbi:unnamed protein product [Staurois parvus]|uniref:Uncharacterized protein n=1 Tax=Staurois parvus TaxID=386267 RepID=A0ABN9FCI6_9NEOB|nr:unnamed protein product [Staurois parvus]
MNLNCFILMFDLILKQMELQDDGITLGWRTACPRISSPSSTTCSRPPGAAPTPARRMRRPWSAACVSPASSATRWPASCWSAWRPRRRSAWWSPPTA